MIRSVLVVCVGNICRSPVGERLLQTLAPQIAVTSAGLGAFVGQPADATASEVAAAYGLDLRGHAARQFTPALGQAADLILVMEPGHKAQISRDTPQLSGKTMLFDHWSGANGIADPYRPPGGGDCSAAFCPVDRGKPLLDGRLRVAWPVLRRLLHRQYPADLSGRHPAATGGTLWHIGLAQCAQRFRRERSPHGDRDRNHPLASDHW